MKPRIPYQAVQAITAMRRAVAAAPNAEKRFEALANAVVGATRGYVDTQRAPVLQRLDKHNARIEDLEARLAQLEEKVLPWT